MKESVRLLLRGCECKKGCNTKVFMLCKCGPGCRCNNCQNIPSSTQLSSMSTSETETSDDVEQEELAGDDNVRQLVMVGIWKLKVTLMKAHES